MEKKAKFLPIIITFCLLCGIALFQTVPPATLQYSCGVLFDFENKLSFQKEFNLFGGEVELSFDFTALRITDVDTSGIIVTINDKEVVVVPMKNNGNKIKLTMALEKGKSIVKFIPFGDANNVSIVILKNIVLKERQLTAGWGTNLIVNGDFEQGTCPSTNDACYFSTKDFQPSFLPGWTPNPEIEIVKAEVFFPKLGNTKVAEVDPLMNSCFKQKLSLKAGKYLLTFNHQAIALWNAPLSTSGVQVKLSGLVLKNIIPTNYENNMETIEFYMTSSLPDQELEFCGLGTSDTIGSGIDNVKLVIENELSIEKII